MIPEKTYGIKEELMDDDYWDDYRINSVAINNSCMLQLAEYFIGFSESPVGVYNHKSYEIQAMKFDNLSKLKDFVKTEHAKGKDMVLYYIFDTTLRFAYV